MRRWLRSMALAGLALPLAAAGGRKLVVVSVSGMDYRFLRDADRLHLKIPVLRRLMAKGETADGVVGIAPTESWPAAASLVTGVAPAQHGILTNYETNPIPKQPSLWQAAADAHLKTALLFWPGSTAVRANFVCPDTWDPPRNSAIPFEPVAEGCTPGFVDRVTGVYPRFSKSIWNDETAMAALDYLLEYEQPDLSLVRLTDLEAEERETGALSLYSREVLENDDEMLGQMLKKLPPHSVVAIVSDYGFETENNVVRPKVLVNSDAVEVKYGLIGTTDARAAGALRKLVGVKKTGIAREVPMAEVRRYAPGGTKWIAAFETMPGYIAVNDVRGSPVGLGNHRGVHDLWPRRANFRSVFILWGEGVAPGRLGEISLLAVAPALASVLGVTLPDAKQALPSVPNGASAKAVPPRTKK